MSRFIQLSDLHLLADPAGELGEVNTQKTLEAVLEKTLDYQPDFLVLTGDISQDGSLASYRRLAKTLASLPFPVYWLLGNHDECHVADQGLVGPNVRSDKYIVSNGWQIILLNSTAYGLDDGFIGTIDFEHLHHCLNLKPELPSLIMMHHPPIAVGCYMDEIRVINDQAFLTAIAPYYQLRGVLFGHIHQVFEKNIGGVVFLGSPATSIQFAPQVSKFALDKEHSPGFRWVELAKDTIKTGIMRV